MNDAEIFDQTPFAMAEFAENPEPRCPCILALDKSGSMSGAPIDALNQGLTQFASALRQDDLAAKRVDIGIIPFGGKVGPVIDFVSADDYRPEPLTAGGQTPMGAAIVAATDLLAARRASYRQAGIAVYRPWLFMITDGVPTDDWTDAARRIREGEERKLFSFFAVGVEGADMSLLRQLSVRDPVALRGLAFGDMFRWLSTSLSAVSRSSVGQVVHPSNPAAPGGWAVI